MHKWIIGAARLVGESHASNEGKLEAIQMAGTKNSKDRQADLPRQLFEAIQCQDVRVEVSCRIVETWRSISASPGKLEKSPEYDGQDHADNMQVTIGK